MTLGLEVLYTSILPLKVINLLSLERTNYHIIGVMSGTSLDGIDLAEIEFEWRAFPNDATPAINLAAPGKWSFKIVNAETIPYSTYWKNDLREAIGYTKKKLERLDFKYTEKLSEEILGFIKRNNIQEIDAICSHGHTILHRPEKGYTLQIGNLPRLAKLISRNVVCDFRTDDVALGGQGAPLVPIGDRLLFPEYDYCLNLGGFANVSSEVNGTRIAYDICPVNIVLNRYAEKLGMDYDEGGKLAKSGEINNELLQKLNMLSFYSLQPPKSLGLEWVKENVFPLLDGFVISERDLLRTFTEHIAIQLGAQFVESAKVLVTGGGAYNSFLMERLAHLANINAVVPSSALVEYKEALIFGLLGVLRLRDEVNCLASVTGASKDHCSGKVFTP